MDSKPRLGSSSDTSWTGERPGAYRELLAFRVGDEDYAIDLHRVREIRGLSSVSRLQGMEADALQGLTEFVIGAVLVRGERVAVVDLRRLLAPTAERDEDDQPSVVVTMGGLPDAAVSIGWLVDEVDDMVVVRTSQIRVERAGNAVQATAVSGDRMLKILDLSRLAHGHPEALPA